MITQLPHLIIKHILSYLDSNIDKTCFILSSKVWFNQVDRLLILNDQHLPGLLSNRQQSNNTYFKHFRNVLNKTIQKKLPIIQYILTNDDTDLYNDLYFDSILNIDEEKEQNDKYNNNDFTYIVFSNNFNRSLDNIFIGPCCTHLFFGELYNQPLTPLPSHVTHIEFGELFDQVIQPGYLPMGLKTLKFNGAMFNQPILPFAIPNSVTTLKLGNNSTFSIFNQPILPNTLPTSLTSLELGSHFDQPLHINSLPKTLLKLTIGVMYDQPILNGVLPIGLKELSFKGDYQHTIEPGVLPNTLKTLKFSPMFNQTLLPFAIPHGVTSVKFGRAFCQDLDANVIPSTVTSLSLFKPSPSTCTNLTQLKSILKLRISPIDTDQLILPPNLLELELHNSSILPNRLLSSSPKLIKLKLSDEYNDEIDKLTSQLPHTLKHLQFGSNYNQPIFIQHNNLYDTKDQHHNIDEDEDTLTILPTSLERIDFGTHFNQPLYYKWLNNVKHISLGRGYCQPFINNQLPKQLTHIHYHQNNNNSITLIRLDNYDDNNKYKSINNNGNSYLILNEQLQGGYQIGSHLSSPILV